MNKKILIGSIIAVAMLIGVSFTSVVGHRGVESGIKSSPLFNIRTQRAMSEESKDLVCDYIGKGKYMELSFSRSNSSTVQIQRFIDIIIRMDNITFNRFINLIFYKLQQSNELKDIDKNDIINSFNKIRNNPERIDVYYNTNNVGYTSKWDDTPTFCWFPGCFIYMILRLIIVFALTPLCLAITLARGCDLTVYFFTAC